jgi:hypothetical protein
MRPCRNEGSRRIQDETKAATPANTLLFYCSGLAKLGSVLTRHILIEKPRHLHKQVIRKARRGALIKGHDAGSLAAIYSNDRFATGG